VQIEHDAIGLVVIRGLEELGPGCKSFDREACGTEQALKGLANERIVVHYGDERRLVGHMFIP